MNRRRWFKSVGVATAVLSLPVKLWAGVRDGFIAETVEDALHSVLGDLPVQESDAINFKIPDIAENGAVVPVSVSTDVADVRAISIVIENNPNPLTTRFEITPETMADVSTRVKMGETSMVRVYVETPTVMLTTAKEVKVTIGGCGG